MAVLLPPDYTPILTAWSARNLERAIADYKAQIAIMTSASVMEKRAKDAGFQRIDPSQAVYVLVPGYTGRQPVVLAAPPGVSDSGISLVKTIYRRFLLGLAF